MNEGQASEWKGWVNRNPVRVEQCRCHGLVYPSLTARISLETVAHAIKGSECTFDIRPHALIALINSQLCCVDCGGHFQE